MSNTVKMNPEEYVILGSKTRFQDPLPANVRVCRISELGSLMHKPPERAVFVSFGQASTDALLKATLGVRPSRRFKQLLTIEPPRAASIPSLQGFFDKTIGLAAQYRWLPPEELIATLNSDQAADRFIGGFTDFEGETLALVRGDRETIVVPFGFFEPSGDGVEPDFRKLAFTDYGHTVALGDYEASADAILYEVDPAYRRMLNQERRKTERSFGASLRRLRIQRKLKRSDFAPLSAKTIARIERNEVGKPRGHSLDIIAQRLDVEPDQIEHY